MAPIPSTLDEEALSLIDRLERRIKDLQDFQIPRLRSCTGPLPVQQRYAVDLREDLDALVRQVEELDILVDDQQGDRNRRELSRIVTEFRDSLNSLRKDTRSALLASKRAMDAQQTSNREELLRSSGQIGKIEEISEKNAEDELMKANNDVTAALRRTIGMMQGELERSVLSTQMLEESTATLKSTASAHDTINLLLSTSKQLVTVLEKSDWLDRLLIISAVVFFFLVVLLILKQRIVDRSLRIAFWWTRFLPFSLRNSDRAPDLMEKGKILATTLATSISSAAVSVASVAFSGPGASPPLTSFEVSLVSESTTSSETAEYSSDPLSSVMSDVISSLESSATVISDTATDAVRTTTQVSVHEEL